MTWRRGGEAESCAASCGHQEVYETNHVLFLSLISILFTTIWLDIRTMVLKPFYHIFGSCSPAKGMVYELSETDRVAMVCSVLQPCVAAMCCSHVHFHWARPTHRAHSRFLSFVSVFGNEYGKCHCFSMYFGLEQYEVLNVNHIKGVHPENRVIGFVLLAIRPAELGETTNTTYTTSNNLHATRV